MMAAWLLHRLRPWTHLFGSVVTVQRDREAISFHSRAHPQFIEAEQSLLCSWRIQTQFS
jgi:hypothetical protein